MTEKIYEIISLAVIIPTMASFVVGTINYYLIKHKFRRDKRVPTWDKIPFYLVGGEIEYLRDLEGTNVYLQYQRHIKIAKYCGIVFAAGFISLIALGTASVFLLP